MTWNPLVSDVRPFSVSVGCSLRRLNPDFCFGRQPRNNGYGDFFRGPQPSREPLVDRTPSIRPSIATASRKARAKALKIASAI